MSTDGRTDKEDMIHKHAHTHTLSGTLFSHEEENKLSFLPFTTTWMKLEGILLSDRSQQRKTNTAWFDL